MSKAVLEKLQAKFGDAVVETHSELGDDTAVVRPEKWRAVCEYLRKDPQMEFHLLADLCGVDLSGLAPKAGTTGRALGGRIEVVVHLASISKRHRLRLKTRVGDDEMRGAEIDSVTSIWPGANWFERECFDMSGVTFKGHPDLRRILMYPEFVGHPLLKDYPANKTQPLIPYRTEEEARVPIEKLPPFREDEGMSFPRKDYGAEAEPRTVTNPKDTEAV